MGGMRGGGAQSREWWAVMGPCAGRALFKGGKTQQQQQLKNTTLPESFYMIMWRTIERVGSATLRILGKPPL